MVAHFPFYIILYYIYILFYQTTDHNVRQIRLHICTKICCCKRRVRKRKTLSGQPKYTATLDRVSSSIYSKNKAANLLLLFLVCHLFSTVRCAASTTNFNPTRVYGTTCTVLRIYPLQLSYPCMWCARV